MEYSGVSEGSGIEMDSSGEVAFEVEVSQLEPDAGPPQSCSTPSKDVGKKLIRLCPFCGKSYSHSQSLRKHTKAVHDKEYKCLVCDKEIGTKVLFESHMNGHSQRKPHQCNTCNKSYQSKEGFLQHSCFSKLKKVKCDECGKKCPTPKALTQHMLSHDAIQHFSCQLVLRPKL